MVLLPLTGVLSAKDTYALFGNEAVFFILGAFLLAAALMKCGLSTRLALAILRRFGHTPRTLLLSLFLMNAFMAFFMSEHAVAAMTFPITLEIARVLGLQPPAEQLRHARSSSPWRGERRSAASPRCSAADGRRSRSACCARRAARASPSLQWTLAAWPIVAVAAGRRLVHHHVVLPDRHRLGPRGRRGDRGEGAAHGTPVGARARDRVRHARHARGLDRGRRGVRARDHRARGGRGDLRRRAARRGATSSST